MIKIPNLANFFVARSVCSTRSTIMYTLVAVLTRALNFIQIWNFNVTRKQYVHL